MPAAGHDPHHARRWYVLAVIGIAQLMVVLDATIVNIALPSAQADLGFSDASRQWVVTAYALAFGGLLLLGGRLSDLFGRKWTFIAGLIGFSVASAIGGSAPSFGVLVAARALQGAFAALLAPSALSILTTTFTDPEERGRAFAIFGAISGGGAAIGLLLGGILTEYLSWRWCLYVNLLFALPAAAVAVRLISNVAHAAHAELDIPGTVLGCGGLFCIVYGFAKAETDGWGATVTLLFLGAGAALLVLFRIWLGRAKNPLVPPRVIEDRNRGGSLLTILMAGLGIFGVFLFLTYFLQQNLGFSPIQAGLAFLPMPITIVTSSIISQTRLLPRVGPRPLIVTGMLFGVAGMLFLSRLDTGSHYAGGVLPGLVILGVGFGMIFSTAINTATLGVIPEDAGVASALVNTCQQVGGAAGTALLSTIAATATVNYLAANGGSKGAAAIHGYTVAFEVSAAIFLAGAIVAGLMLRGGKLPGASAESVHAGAH
ncbi:MAG: MFS transporter [Solirubrobacteraceae bacterium]|nr:MFS transporter [Solirubrobacteraceae bacterium]